MRPSDDSTLLLLNRTLSGDDGAADDLFTLVYDELRGMAANWMNGDARRLTLQPTALVHEAYLKLIGAASLDFNSRTHFRAIAARAMHQVMADHFRAGKSKKRGGGWERVTLSEIEDVAPRKACEMNEALNRLTQVDQRAATVVILKFFGGLNVREISQQLDVTERTVNNDWRMARAWLRADLDHEGVS